MTVYIEYVLIDNFVIDYLLLKATYYVLKKDYSKIRIVLSSILGALFSLFLPLLILSTVYEILVKILVGIVIALLSNKSKGVKDALSVVLTFMFCTFIFGGSVYAVFNLLKIEVGSEFSILVMIIPILIIYKILKSLVSFYSKNREILSVTYEVSITKNGKKTTGKGFLDTGNLTFIENKPVVFCSFSFLEKILEIKDFNGLKKIRILTATGEKENYRVLLDEFSVFYNGAWNTYNNVWATIVKSEILENADALFGSAFLGGINAKITA